MNNLGFSGAFSRACPIVAGGAMGYELAIEARGAMSRAQPSHERPMVGRSFFCSAPRKLRVEG